VNEMLLSRESLLDRFVMEAAVRPINKRLRALIRRRTLIRSNKALPGHCVKWAALATRRLWAYVRRPKNEARTTLATVSDVDGTVRIWELPPICHVRK
jgi:hypothetical protein